MHHCSKSFRARSSHVFICVLPKVAKGFLCFYFVAIPWSQSLWAGICIFYVTYINIYILRFHESYNVPNGQSSETLFLDVFTKLFHELILLHYVYDIILKFFPWIHFITLSVRLNYQKRSRVTFKFSSTLLTKSWSFQCFFLGLVAGYWAVVDRKSCKTLNIEIYFNGSVYIWLLSIAGDGENVDSYFNVVQRRIQFMMRENRCVINWW